MSGECEKRLAVFDHARGSKLADSIRDLKGACNLLDSLAAGNEIIANNYVEEAKAYQAVLWHEPTTDAGDDQRLMPDFVELCNKSANGSVRVAFSQQGVMKDSPGKNEKGIIVLHIVQRGTDLEEDDWSKIIATITDSEAVKTLLSGEGDPRIQKYFYQVEQRPNYASALFILCQGYLLTWLMTGETNLGANGGTDAEAILQFRKEASLKCRKKVEEGLAVDVKRIQGSLAFHNPGERFSKVQKPGWWRHLVPDPASPALGEIIERELRPATGGGVPPEIEKLIGSFADGASGPQPEVVWAAYEALDKALKGLK